MPKAPATATPAPRILSNQEYLEQFGPAADEHYDEIIQDLKPGQVFILPFREKETARNAKLRAIRLISRNSPPPPPPSEISPTLVCGGGNSPGTWKISAQ